MDTVLIKCIYCESDFDPTVGKGDHVLPEALGKFDGLKVFRGCCVKCNNAIGKSEEELIRCGPEAYLARISDPPRRRKKGSNKWIGANGAPAPTMTTERHGANLLVQLISRGTVGIDIPDQIVIEDQNGKHYPIPLHPNWTKESIRRKVDSFEIEGKFHAHLSISDNSATTMEQVVDALWPDEELHEFSPTEVGHHRIKISQSYTVSDRYFQSIVKMAFHYYLCYNNHGLRGNEPEFAAVRKFIREGGYPEEFIVSAEKSPVKFGTPFGKTPCGGAITPGEWCHIFGAEDSYESIIVCLYLFLGPGYVHEPHYVVLGNRSSTDVDGGTWSHLLRWEPGSNEKGSFNRIETKKPYGMQILTGPGLSNIDRNSWCGLIL